MLARHARQETTNRRLELMYMHLITQMELQYSELDAEPPKNQDKRLHLLAAIQSAHKELEDLKHAALDDGTVELEVRMIDVE